MTFARIKKDNEIFFAVFKDDKYYRINGDCFNILSIDEKAIEADFTLLSPVLPTKIIALGVNYRKHAEEMGLEVKGEPLIFMKPISAVIANGEKIRLANTVNRIDYEAELCIVIGKNCHHVKKENAADYILGYTCGNDVSDRIQQKNDGQWIRAKGYDTYCPLGPHIVSDIDPYNLRIQAILNGKIAQDANTSDMITGAYEAVEFISGIMTLCPGDIIMTGTPQGIGPLKEGDEIEIRIENIGSLKNSVRNI